jgi:hypothetical protein
MSNRARIGELLSQLVPLSGHDVEEILQEQSSSRRRFGEIALSWGLCKPEHVWDAWCRQSADGPEMVDLEKIGIDAQAAGMLPGEVARQLGVIPVRLASDAALVATTDTAPEHAAENLSRHLHRRIKFVQAPRGQLLQMIEMYYPRSTAQAG